MQLNPANVLTLVRISLIPVLAALLLSTLAASDLLSAIVFVIASATDALDGWLARRRSEVTQFGKLMDPLADKLLITSALVSLVALYRLDAWVAMVIIAREFAVTGLRLLAIEQGQVVSASVERSRAASTGMSEMRTSVRTFAALSGSIRRCGGSRAP